MLVIIDTEKARTYRVRGEEEDGTRTITCVRISEALEDARPIITCANCDVWKKVSYLDGYGICQRTTSLEHKKHFCSSGQPRMTFVEET